MFIVVAQNACKGTDKGTGYLATVNVTIAGKVQYHSSFQISKKNFHKICNIFFAKVFSLASLTYSGYIIPCHFALSLWVHKMTATTLTREQNTGLQLM